MTPGLSHAAVCENMVVFFQIPKLKNLLIHTHLQEQEPFSQPSNIFGPGVFYVPVGLLKKKKKKAFIELKASE